MAEFEDRPHILKYEWDYFLAHAQARLTTFRFYLLYTGAVGAGMVSSFDKETPVFIALSFLLAFLTGIYWQIDQRHRYIIDKAQKALIALETSSLFPSFQEHPELRLFSNDEDEKNRRVYVLTYSKLVQAVFLVVFVISFLLGFYFLLTEIWPCMRTHPQS